MEKTRRLKVFSIVALVVAVLGLTIAFAALSKTLTINGTGSVDAANWDIHFKNISEATLTGKATTTGTPSLEDNGATINDMKVSLKEPGDKVVYTVDIENSGDINAEIDSITLPTFTTAQSNILDFKAVYTSNNKEISQGDILESKETKNVTITIMYKDITDESLLPKEGISINLKYELHFVQTDKASGSSSQGGNNPVSTGTLIRQWSLSDTIDMTYYDGEEQGDGKYKGGTLVISGSGDMPDFGHEDENLYKIQLYLGDTTLENVMNNQSEYFDSSGNLNTDKLKYNPSSVIIEEGITSVGVSSFMYLPINTVDIASSVKIIGMHAFSGCSSLTNVLLREGIKVIDEDVFTNTALTSIRIPSTVEKMWDLDVTTLKTVYFAPEEFELYYGTFQNISDDSVIYVKTQEVVDSLNLGYEEESHNYEYYDKSKTKVIVDPSKFE